MKRMAGDMTWLKQGICSHLSDRLRCTPLACSAHPRQFCVSAHRIGLAVSNVCCWCAQHYTSSTVLVTTSPIEQRQGASERCNMAPVVHALDMAKLVKLPTRWYRNNMQTCMSLLHRLDVCGILQDEVLVCVIPALHLVGSLLTASVQLPVWTSGQSSIAC